LPRQSEPDDFVRRISDHGLIEIPDLDRDASVNGSHRAAALPRGLELIGASPA
jgi:hypothetical protein